MKALMPQRKKLHVRAHPCPQDVQTAFLKLQQKADGITQNQMHRDICNKYISQPHHSKLEVDYLQ